MSVLHTHTYTHANQSKGLDMDLIAVNVEEKCDNLKTKYFLLL